MREEDVETDPPRRRRSRKQPAGQPVPAPAADQGSFALGFIGGLLGGCIVFALILRRGKTMTLNGAFLGFALQLIIAFVASR